MTLTLAICTCLVAVRAIAAQGTAGDPDQLYRNRATPADAGAAFAIWSSRLAGNADDFESAWKLARVAYWLGTEGPADKRRAMLEQGVEAGRRAAMLQPTRPEGLFWMAADMGALAESFGLRQGLKYRGDIRDALEKVQQIDPAWQQGSALRALGRWYFKVPRLFGGNDRTSEDYLRKSLTYAPDSIASRYFLAETLFALKRDDEARQELQRVLDTAPDPEWTPEDQSFKRQARALLDQHAAR